MVVPQGSLIEVTHVTSDKTTTIATTCTDRPRLILLTFSL